MNTLLHNSIVPDASLVTRSLAGERNAFGLLVTRHQAAACGVAYAVCGDFPASEDAAQDAFVSAWKQLAELRDTSRFRAWVCGITRQIALNRVRRRDRRSERLSVVTPPEPAVETASPCEEVIATEESALLWQTLARLPASYREPLVMFYREQQSIAAVATALDLSEEAVKQRLSRGRALLREELAGRIEGVLGRTRPGSVFTKAVLSALPPVAVGFGLTVAAGSAKAAVTGGVGSSTTTGGVAAGATVAASVASGAVGLLSLYVLLRFLRTPEIPKAIRQVVGRAAGWSLSVSVIFAAWIFWIALTRGAPLVARGLSPVATLTLGIVAFVAVNAAISLRASRALARLPTRLVRGHRYVSPWRWAGLPLVSIAFGADPARGERHGIARGWIAIGDIAFGVVAIGGLAVGPIAVGGVAAGLVAIGGGAGGLAAVGGLAVGWAAAGGIALAWNFAAGGLAVAHDFAVGGLAVACVRAIGAVAMAAFHNAGTDPSGPAWHGVVMRLIPHAGWLSLLGVPGLLIALASLRRQHH